MDDLLFKSGEASLATLAEQTEAIVKSLDDPAGRAALEAAGFDPSTLAGVDFKFTTTRQAGVLGVGETVIVSVAASHVIAPVAKKVLLDLWKVIVLPRIRRRFGKDAIGPARERVAKKTSAQKGGAKKVGAAKAASPAKKAKPSGGKPRKS